MKQNEKEGTTVPQICSWIRGRRERKEQPNVPRDKDRRKRR